MATGIKIFFIVASILCAIALLTLIVMIIKDLSHKTQPQRVPAYRTVPVPVVVAPKEAPVAVPVAEEEEEEETMPLPPVRKAPTQAKANTGDKFIDSLTAKEQDAFFTFFIHKKRGNFVDLVDYQIGGENQEFFSHVFIHLSEFRNYVPNGLVIKMYKRAQGALANI